MKLKLRWFFYLMIVAAVLLTGYRWYQRLPPTAYEVQSNESTTDRENEYPRYSRLAVSYHDQPTLGYYFRFTNKESYSATENRVIAKDGQLFFDGRQIFPRKGKFLVLIRDGLKQPKLVELDQQETTRFMDFSAGDVYFDDWNQLWLDLAEEARIQGEGGETP